MVGRINLRGKSIAVAAALAAMLGGLGSASAVGGYWVIKDASTGKCPIVTENPIIGGNILFGTGPYNSLDDAKLARSGISVCPKDQDDK